MIIRMRLLLAGKDMQIIFVFVIEKMFAEQRCLLFLVVRYGVVVLLYMYQTNFCFEQSKDCTDAY